MEIFMESNFSKIILSIKLNRRYRTKIKKFYETKVDLKAFVDLVIHLVDS